MDEIEYEFTWDATKAASNLAKHGVAFQQGTEIFADPLALTTFDAAHSIDEERWFTLGMDGNGRLLAVSHTFAHVDPARALIRIISARPATRRERAD